MNLRKYINLELLFDIIEFTILKNIWYHYTSMSSLLLSLIDHMTRNVVILKKRREIQKLDSLVL